MSNVQKTRMPNFSKVSTFYPKTLIEGPIFIRKKLYSDDPNDTLFWRIENLIAELGLRKLSLIR